MGDLAQLQQVTQKIQRVHAHLEHVRPKAHGNVPAIGGWRGISIGAAGQRCLRRRSSIWSVAAKRTQPLRQTAPGFGQSTVFVKAALLHHRQQAANVVAALQQQSHHVAAQAQLAIAQPVQQVFQNVGEALDVVQLHHARGPLDGVGSAEDGVEHIGISVALLHAQQAIFHRCELLARFLDKDAVNFFHGSSLRA